MKLLFLSISFLGLLQSCSRPAELPPPPSSAPARTVTSAPTDTKVPLNFNTVFEKVIKVRCLACHSAAAGNIAGINLEHYAKVVAIKDLVLSEVLSRRMPLPPAPGLDNEQTDLIVRWIEAGASEN